MRMEPIRAVALGMRIALWGQNQVTSARYVH